MPNPYEIVDEVFVDMNDNSMVVTPEMLERHPGLVDAYREADRPFNDEINRIDYLYDMTRYQGTVACGLGTVSYSLLATPGATEVIGKFLPINDCGPKTSCQVIYGYTEDEPTVSRRSARPDTFSATSKSISDRDVLSELGRNVSVLTVNNVIPSGCFTDAEHSAMQRGDYRAMGGILDLALNHAEAWMQQDGRNVTFGKTHIAGASLGAGFAVGAATDLVIKGEREVASLTIQEPVIMEKGVFTTLGTFLKNEIGEDSEAQDLVDYRAQDIIAQSAFRSAIDRDGFGLGWVGRFLSALPRTRNRGMAHARNNDAVNQLAYLADQDINILGVFGENSGMSQSAQKYMPREAAKLIVRSVEGGKAPHMINENQPVSTYGIVANVTRS